MLEHRLLGNKLRVLNFYGNLSTFYSFWELFEELVHKQPYSNIEKSTLINCCKGDAARTLQMIPRTGDCAIKRPVSGPKANKHADDKLKSMKQCPDDYRSLGNNLNHIQAIIATLEKQGEIVNTTNMRTMFLETFSKKIQDEMVEKEFDSSSP
uniref:Reverse transcriptase domain-containing protein n=1 Tax=Haemonchus placei TaxID=6290 RepID=A0A0N4WT43_HAEPC